LIRIHHAQIASSQTLRPVLNQLRIDLRRNLHRERDLTGWNAAGLGYVKRELVDHGVVGFEVNETEVPEKGVKKRAFPAIA
jgi:U3 small nucleolar RNA-associated protein 12